MAKKKTRKDYDYYSMSIPNELRLLLEAYIRRYPHLGYKNVSQLILNLVQNKAEEIIKNNPDLREILEIEIDGWNYVLQKDGKYNKIKKGD